MSMEPNKRDEENDFDQFGLSRIHYAVINSNHRNILRLTKRKPDRLELVTKDDKALTPLLIASTQGNLETVKLLRDLNADITATDTHGDGIVKLTALEGHYPILEYFLNDEDKLNVIQDLMGMLLSNDDAQTAASKALKYLSENATLTSDTLENAVIVSSFLSFLNAPISSEEAKEYILEILRTFHLDTLQKANGFVVLVGQFLSNRKQVQILSLEIARDLLETAILKDTEVKHLTNFLQLLERETDENVLEECLQTLCCFLCKQNQIYKDMSVVVSIVNLLIPLLSKTENTCLQRCAIWVLSSIADDNNDNKTSIIKLGGLQPITRLLSIHEPHEVIWIANCIEKLCFKNIDNQQVFYQSDAFKLLLRVLRRTNSTDIRLAVVGAMWSIAGDDIYRQTTIANAVGLHQSCDFLSNSATARLNYYGTEMLAIVCRNKRIDTLDVSKTACFHNLIRISNESSNCNHIISSLRALRTLLIDPGYIPNYAAQTRAAAENAIPVAIRRVEDSSDPLQQSEAAYTLGALAYLNKSNIETVFTSYQFDIQAIVDLMRNGSNLVKVNAGSGLALLLFNNTTQVRKLKISGQLLVTHFYDLMDTVDRNDTVIVAYQLVVLCKGIPDEAPAVSAATSIKIIVDNVSQEDKDMQLLCCGLVSSLSRIQRAGIPNALVSIGIIKLLCSLLFSGHTSIRFSAAIALSSLSYVPEGGRQLINLCRETPTIYYLLREHTFGQRLSKQFMTRWNHLKTMGLPVISIRKPQLTTMNTLEDRLDFSYSSHNFEDMKTAREK